MTAHTPGPWKVDNENPLNVLTDEGWLLAQTSYWRIKEPTAMANARLIAAAPGLLEALENAYSILMDGQPDDQVDYYTLEARVRARAAIAKAKGESNA